MTLDPLIAISIAFSIGMFLSILSAFTSPIGSSIPNASTPCSGSPEAVRVGFYGERILFGGGSFSSMRSANNNQGSFIGGFAAALVYIILICLLAQKSLSLSLSKIALPILIKFNTVFGFLFYPYLLLAKNAITLSLQLLYFGLLTPWRLFVRGFGLICALPIPGPSAPSSVQACRREVIAREMGDFLAEDMVVWAGRWPGPDSHDPSFDPYTPLAVDSGDVERGELSAAVHSART